MVPYEPRPVARPVEDVRPVLFVVLLRGLAAFVLDKLPTPEFAFAIISDALIGVGGSLGTYSLRVGLLWIIYEMF